MHGLGSNAQTIGADWEVATASSDNDAKVSFSQTLLWDLHIVVVFLLWDLHIVGVLLFWDLTPKWIRMLWDLHIAGVILFCLNHYLYNNHVSTISSSCLFYRLNWTRYKLVEVIFNRIQSKAEVVSPFWCQMRGSNLEGLIPTLLYSPAFLASLYKISLAVFKFIFFVSSYDLIIILFDQIGVISGYEAKQQKVIMLSL